MLIDLSTTSRSPAHSHPARYGPSRTARLSAAVLGAAVLSAAAVVVPALPAAADVIDSVNPNQDRATVREYPGRLVLANARPGDRIELTGQCAGWVRVRVLQPSHAMATTVGWMLPSSLTEARKDAVFSELPDACDRRDEDADRWRNWVGAMNAPFRSLRRATVEGVTGWRRVTFGTRVAVSQSPECVPSLNYTRRADAPDIVDAAQRVEGLELARASYRYVTIDGSVALVAVPRLGSDDNIWAFVPSGCLAPAGGRHAVYFDEPVVQVQDLRGLEPGEAYSSATIRSRGCSAALLSPSHPRFGYWPDPHPANRPPCPV